MRIPIFLCCLLSGSFLLAADAPKVEVTTLAGKTHTGTLEKISESSLQFLENGKSKTLTTKELLGVRFLDTKPKTKVERKAIRVRLIDGTEFDCKSVTSKAETVHLETLTFGRFSLSVKAVSSIRFAEPNAKLEEAWNQYQKRRIKKDYLVLPRGNVLDHLDGFVGDISATQVNFVLGDNSSAVERSRVFAVLYARNATASRQPTCSLALTDGKKIQTSALSWDGKKFSAKLMAGVKIPVPLKLVQNLDYSLGKIAFLSQMEPRETQYTPFFDTPADRDLMRIRKDRNQDGKPITIGKKEFRRGLWIHSKTYLRYRIAQNYSKFQAIAGIERIAASRGRGDVHLVISGDGKKLFESDILWSEVPRKLDLDVSGYRDFEILVDFRSLEGRLDHGISDHLALGDAKFIK